MFALVRIVHRRDPEKMKWPDICKLYHEAIWYERWRITELAKVITAAMGGSPS